jgi:RimJ/RimL family protein N-acetyltransferase
MSHRAGIAQHLLALDSEDRYLRFGFAASDLQIQHYVDGLNFERDEIFGIYDWRLDLIAVAHLAYAVDQNLQTYAEFGVSVWKAMRTRGYGTRLFERAVMHARNDNVSRMLIHALSENAVMLAIARRAGASVERDGVESKAHLRLPPATLNTQLAEMVADQWAFTDYHLKAQSKPFWLVFETMQNPPVNAAKAADDASS